jgi:hypothetical protein
MRARISVSVAEECVRQERPTTTPSRGKIMLATLVCGILISTSGCSSSATIDGTVNYGGGPVAYGSIAFEPKDTHQKKVVATIDEGKFQANDVAKGPSVIRICVGERPAGKTGSLINSTPTGTLVEISKSEKNITGGAQTLKFNLKAG